MTLLVLHLWSLVHGLGAVLACLFVLHLAGLVLLPPWWRGRRVGDAGPLVLGTAVYVLVAWFAIRTGVTMTPIALSFTAVVLAAAVLRRRHLRRMMARPMLAPRTRWWLTQFAAFYTIAYLFTLAPVSPDRLPIAWLGNVDILRYLVYARHLQHLGPPPLVAVSADSYVYYQTPGVYSVLDGLALFFHREPMNAAMPALFGAAALCGCAAASLARRVFGIGRTAAWLAGATMLAAPFFRFILGQYYLTTLLAVPLLLNLLQGTVAMLDGVRPRAVAWTSFAAHDVLLLFLYPYLLVVAIFFQGVALVIGTVLRLRDRVRGSTLRSVARAAVAIAIGLLALGVMAPKHVLWVSRMFRELSQVGRWGWPLDAVSPFAVLGLPCIVMKTTAMSAAVRQVYVVASWSLAVVGLAGAFAPRAWLGFPRRARVFLGLAGAGFATYAGYFTLVGPSYQQWKFASYTALPMAFVLVAAVCRLLLHGVSRRGRPAPPSGRVRRLLAVAVGLAMLAGNGIVHAVADPALVTVGAGMRNLTSLNDLPFKDFSVELRDVHNAFLTAYFVPGKHLHVALEDFYANEPVRLEDISPARPRLLFSLDCEGVGHGDVLAIEGVGCLAFQPPSLVAGRAYSFGRTFLFIEHWGLGARYGWGRSNVRDHVELTLVADPRRLRIEHDAAWLNILVQAPVARKGLATTVRVSWGDGRHGDVQVGEREWISLPLRLRDWTGEWLARLTVRLDFGDAGARPPEQGAAASGPVPAALEFCELAVGPEPRGRAVFTRD